MVFRADRRDPIGGFLKGEAAPSGFEPTKQRKRYQEAECAKNVTRDLVRLLHLAGDEQQEQGAHEWREQDYAQDVLSKKVHALCLSAHAAQQYLHMVPVIRQKNDEP